MDAFAKLGFNVSSLIAQVISFGLLLLVLRMFAYKPIMKMLDQRAQRIRESLEAGERAKQEAVSAEKEVAKKIEEASASGQKIVEQASKAAEDVRRRAEQDARKEAEAIIEKAKAETVREKEESMTELRKEVADLAVAVAGKAISRSLDKETQRALIDNVMKEASSLGKG
jgi:F-type H+-transporting ATPase subunit b